MILDTNFINFSIKNKIDIVRGLMDCLLAKVRIINCHDPAMASLTNPHSHVQVIPCVTTCVIAELEKLGPKFRIALRLAKDPRFRRIKTEGEYADDNIVKLVTEVRAEAATGTGARWNRGRSLTRVGSPSASLLGPVTRTCSGVSARSPASPSCTSSRAGTLLNECPRPLAHPDKRSKWGHSW